MFIGSFFVVLLRMYSFPGIKNRVSYIQQDVKYLAAVGNRPFSGAGADQV